MRNDTRYEKEIKVRGLCTVAAAVLGGAALTGIASAGAASSAAGSQEQASQNATNAQLGMFNTTQSNLKPFISQGANATNTISNDLKNGTLGGQFTNADLNANLAPNYQFQLQQGQQALQNSQAASDGVLSGSALKGLQNFTQNTASGAYQNAYNNWLGTQNLNYGQQIGLASLGENAAAQVGNNATATGQSIGQNMIGAGNAAAAGTIGAANAVSGAVNTGSGYYALNNLTGGSLFGNSGPDNDTSSPIV